MRVYVVAMPGEDIEVFAKHEDAIEFAHEVCDYSDWRLDWGELERFEFEVVKHPLVETVARVETPEGVLVVESCEVK